MNKLEKIKEIGFNITWKFINIGYFGYKFVQKQITKQDLCEYSYSLLERIEIDYNEITQLTDKEIKDYKIEQILDKLIKFDNSDIELQYQKWIIFLTKEMIENLNGNYFENLLIITEFWLSLGQPKNSPHIFQAVENTITPKDYYTEEMYNSILYRHKDWINEEIQKIKQLENN